MFTGNRIGWSWRKWMMNKTPTLRGKEENKVPCLVPRKRWMANLFVCNVTQRPRPSIESLYIYTAKVVKCGKAEGISIGIREICGAENKVIPWRVTKGRNSLQSHLVTEHMGLSFRYRLYLLRNIQLHIHLFVEIYFLFYYPRGFEVLLL